MVSRLLRTVFLLALALLLASNASMVFGQGDRRLLTTVHPTLGKLLGRMQRGGEEILLYENGEIVVDKSDESPQPLAVRSAPTTLPDPKLRPPTVATPKPKPRRPAVTASAPTAPATAPEPVRQIPLSSPSRPYKLPTLNGYDSWALPDPPPDVITPDREPHPVGRPAPSVDEAQGVIASLVAQLADGDIMVRHQAKQALVRMGAPAVGPVMDALRQPEQPDHLYKAAADVLGELRDPRAVALLSEQLVSEGFSARIETVIALGKIGDSAAAPALLKVITMSEYSPKIRAAAYKALGETKSHIAIRPLMRAVHLDRRDICQAEAINALDLITGQEFRADNARRTAWLKEHHPDWWEASPDTVVDKRFLGIIKLFTAGVLIASGVGILLVTR